MDRENSEVEMEMQRKERLNEKESREARKTARRKSVEVWATDCERAVEPINRADFMSGFDDGWLSAIKYASQQRWVEVADGVPHGEKWKRKCTAKTAFRS